MAIQNVLNQKKKRRRRSWSKEWLLNRAKYSHMQLIREIQENNPDDFRNYLRMDDECFQHLLSAVTPQIQKQDTVMREAITPEQRLIATLRYLATGRSLQDLKFTTGISPQALGKIIPETCKALITVLQAEYIKVILMFSMFSKYINLYWLWLVFYRLKKLPLNSKFFRNVK